MCICVCVCVCVEGVSMVHIRYEKGGDEGRKWVWSTGSEAENLRVIEGGECYEENIRESVWCGRGRVRGLYEVTRVRDY